MSATERFWRCLARMRGLVIALVACSAPPKRVAPQVVAPPPRAPQPLWPVPMRVMTWTPDGLVQVGVLPDAPPASLPSTPWFVEPTKPIDAAMLERVATALRDQGIPGLSLRGQNVDFRWLGMLHDLPSVTALVLDDTGVTTSALQHSHLALQRLYLARTAVDDTTMQQVVQAYPKLEVIDIEDCAVTDAGIAKLAAISTLRAINASGTRITDAGGVALGGLANLEVVDLGRTQVGVKTVEALASHPLHQLFLDGTHAGRAVAKLAQMAPGLERIDLSSLVGYRPTDADVGWIATAPNLVEVGLSKSRITDKLVLAIAQLPRIEEVRLAGTSITATAIDKLAQRTELEEVDLAETAVTDANAAALIALPHIRMLRLDRTGIGDNALAKPGPALLELYLSHTKVTDVGLAILDELANLEGLGLGHTAVHDATVARIAKLGKLRTLVLSAVRTDKDLFATLALPLLERLYVDETHANGTLVEAIKGSIPHLRVLHLASTDIADDALDALAEFTRIEELTLGDSRLQRLPRLEAWPHLTTLSLVGLQIGDAQLPAIAKTASLRRLDLSSTDVTDPAPLALLPNLVELGLSQTRLTTAGKTAANALAKRGVRVVR